MAFALIALPPFWEPASACSPALHKERPDAFVLYGEVIAHVQTTYLSKTARGVRIAPRHRFRIPEPSADDTYELYPMGLAPDCEPVPETAQASIEQRFPLHSLHGIVAWNAQTLGLPGDIAPTPHGALFDVPADCDVAELARRAHDYRDWEVACGNYRFEANKDLARLEHASPTERIEILERLASYRLSLAYGDVVATHVPPAAGMRLLELRYAGYTDDDCLQEPTLRDRHGEHPERLLERCSQQTPYAPPERWDLYAAILDGRADALAAFLAEGGDPNAVLRGTPSGYVRPLKVAIYSRQEDAALTLLRAGADFETSGVSLYQISQLGMARLLDFLLDQAPQRIERELGLASICSRGHHAVLEVVLRHAAARQVDLSAALSEAVAACISYGATDTARLMLAHGVPVTDTMLFVAARHAAIGMVRSLLALGADPFARYRDEAAPGDHLDGAAAIDFALLEYEYLPPEQVSRRHYVLHELAVAGPPPRNGMRLEAIALDGMEEIARNELPADKLVVAARLGFFDVAQELLEDAAASTPGALTDAMNAALEARHPDIATLLIGAGATTTGALHAAARMQLAGVVEYLLARGVDPNERADGRTPIDVLLESDNTSSLGGDAILHKLLAAGAELCRPPPLLNPGGAVAGTVRSVAPDCGP